MSEWISVDDRMPEGCDYEIFLVTTCGSVTVAYCSPKQVFLHEPYGLRVDNITHWQPLPEPPQ